MAALTLLLDAVQGAMHQEMERQSVAAFRMPVLERLQVQRLALRSKEQASHHCRDLVGRCCKVGTTCGICIVYKAKSHRLSDHGCAHKHFCARSVCRIARSCLCCFAALLCSAAVDGQHELEAFQLSQWT